MKKKQLSNPISTGGGGVHFEAHIQASFVVLMLTGGYAPCLPCWPIVEIKLQGKIDGFETDDLVVFVEEPRNHEKQKALIQVKHSVNITKKDSVFSEVIQRMWSDFDNPKMFTKGKDALVLITGPINRTDIQNMNWLLEQARSTRNSDEFYRYVEKGNVGPTKREEKLEVFKHNLELAKDNITKDEVYMFLKHFYLLGYDLGSETGVVLALLHSHISQFHRDFPKWLWSRIVDFVQTCNQNAATITIDKIPEDIKKEFEKPIVANMPVDLINPINEPRTVTLSQYQYASDIARANLIGAWNENIEADKEALEKVMNEQYTLWVDKARELVQLSDSPFSHKNGLWKLSGRMVLWDDLGSRIFDQDIDIFKDVVFDILTERDPSFELATEERFAASIHGKVLSHSHAQRESLADSVALLGNKGKALVNCSLNKAENTTKVIIRDIFSNADWKLWGSLNGLLPTLAEADSDEFLDAVEKALSQNPCPFDELFSQEGDFLSGTNYLTGLLWALEGIAWEEEYLVRVCCILSELSNHDPGGKWSNRPIESLITILLPWYPQTLATIRKRKVAVQTLCKNYPKIAWKLIISLLPKQHQTAMGSYKPKWRDIDIPDEKSVTTKEYWEQVTNYTELAVDMAEKNTENLCELVEHFDEMPKQSFDRLIKLLSSDAVLELSEDERLPLWNRIIKFTAKHHRFADADWALNDNILFRIEEAAEKLAPQNPESLYQHLFTDRDMDLYEEKGDWKEQQDNLDQRRIEAVGEILKQGDLKAIMGFVDNVESPGKVGFSLAYNANSKIDFALLQSYLVTGNKSTANFLCRYIGTRHHLNGWKWVDGIDMSSWNDEQLGQFHCCLPFTNETWNRVTKLLGDSEDKYWKTVLVNPYQAEGDLGVAIDKLIKYARPHAAIRCLDKIRHDKQPININQTVKALTKALTSTEPSYAMDVYDIVELIKILQESEEVKSEDLFLIEWGYLPLLDRYNKAAPKYLESRLANDPEFFHEVISIIYKSKNEDAPKKTQKTENKAIIKNAWLLLHEWKTPPGTKDDGGFDGNKFQSWLNRTIEICTKSGHLEVALVTIGEVLIHCPADENGVWIDLAVAKVLNDKNYERMRSGFTIGLANSRGVHWIDPTGKPEKVLSEQYREKGNDIENAGFHRFAGSLRKLADSYLKEAEYNISEHKDEE